MAKSEDKSKEKEDVNSVDKQNRDTLGKDYKGPEEVSDAQSSSDDEAKDPNKTPAGTPKDKKVEHGKY